MAVLAAIILQGELGQEVQGEGEECAVPAVAAIGRHVPRGRYFALQENSFQEVLRSKNVCDAHDRVMCKTVDLAVKNYFQVRLA